MRSVVHNALETIHNNEEELR